MALNVDFRFFFGFSLKLKSLKKNFFSLFYTIFKMLGKPRKFFFAIKILVRVSVNQKKVELVKKTLDDFNMIIKKMRI